MGTIFIVIMWAFIFFGYLCMGLSGRENISKTHSEIDETLGKICYVVGVLCGVAGCVISLLL